MKKTLLLSLFLTILTSCDEKPNLDTGYTPNENITLSENDNILFLSINTYRVEHGLSELKKDSLATTLASKHVLYMIGKGVLSHDGFYDRANLTNSKTIGEIVAYNYISPTSILSAYLASPKHKAILDKPNFTHIGVSTTQNYNCCILTGY